MMLVENICGEWWNVIQKTAYIEQENKVKLLIVQCVVDSELK